MISKQSKSIRPLAKLAYAKGFEGDKENVEAVAYLTVREDSSFNSTYKLPAEVKFRKRSIIGIMAATKDGVIGRNNALPWYYPDEIKHFRAITHNSIVIMGCNTYQSMPKTLFIDRQVFVLSNDNNLRLNRAKVFTSLQKCLEHLKESKTNDKIFMIGGGQIAHLFLEHNLISSFILTAIHKLYFGDVYLDLRYFRRWTRYVLKKSNDYTIYLLKNPEEVSWNL